MSYNLHIFPHRLCEADSHFTTAKCGLRFEPLAPPACYIHAPEINFSANHFSYFTPSVNHHVLLDNLLYAVILVNEKLHSKTLFHLTELISLFNIISWSGVAWRRVG